MDNLINFERYYDVFRDISRIVHASVDVEEVLELVAWKSAEMFGAQGACLRIINLKTMASEKFAAYGLEDEHIERGPFSGEEFYKRLYQLKKVTLTKDISASPNVKNPEYLKSRGIQSIVDIPMILREDVIGIIRVYFTNPVDLTAKELDFIGAVSETCACAIDKARMIEEQKSQYNQLALQTEKLSALGRMAAGIAHEINNPLAGILLFSTNMLKKNRDEGQMKEGLEVIIHETQRCKAIIQDLLEFSRDKEPRKSPARINDVLEKSLSILNNEFRLNHITVETDLSADMPDILMDVNLMQQVFVNLLINAIEAIKEKGVIRIRSFLSPDRQREIIEIADTGQGLPKEHFTRIFDPFFSTKKSGTGLGLAVSYGIVQKHNGNILVASEQGKGTVFTLEIPVISQAGSPGTRSVEPAIGTRPSNSD
jgi:two-component system, NtrC family, sensor kinase